MPVPQILADTLARLVQKAPVLARIDPEIAFAEIPAHTEAITIPTRHGDLPATVHLPEGGSTGKGVYLNFHGGGFVMRHPEQDDPLCRYLARHADVSVVSVDYIPAPQSRCPGPVEQAFDVALWAASSDRPWDAGRLTIGGQSAGGSLAAGASRLALELGGPRVGLQVLMYPALDLTIPAQAKVADGTWSFLAKGVAVFDAVYCPDPALRTDRLVSPAAATDDADLTGIAPAVIVTTQKDILRAEGIRYADRLDRAGALLEHLDLSGVGHAFNVASAPRETVLAAYDCIVEHVRRVPPGAQRPSASTT